MRGRDALCGTAMSRWVPRFTCTTEGLGRLNHASSTWPEQHQGYGTSCHHAGCASAWAETPPAPRAEGSTCPEAAWWAHRLMRVAETAMQPSVRCRSRSVAFYFLAGFFKGCEGLACKSLHTYFEDISHLEWADTLINSDKSFYFWMLHQF